MKILVREIGTVSGPPNYGDGNIDQALANRKIIGKIGEKSSGKSVNKGGRLNSKKADRSRFAILSEDGEEEPIYLADSTSVKGIASKPLQENVSGVWRKKSGKGSRKVTPSRHDSHHDGMEEDLEDS
ncbi:hypothetical protein LWI28_005705 [Acer negundo]|uniref:Uncharacterized protein n=1 Tax=Acer negundo TaxID=4023 RepID=A0AAD5NLA7_ACENE|nr:hypothetical protein LWI28_005705 [Acer negundo]